MALNTVQVTWNLTDFLQTGIPDSCTISFSPTSVLADSADSKVIPALPRSRTFTGGTGSLSGIVANDNSSLAPSGTAYEISVFDNASGQVIVGPFTTTIAYANGSVQDLSYLFTNQSTDAATFFQYVAVPQLTPLVNAILAPTLGTCYSVLSYGADKTGTVASDSAFAAALTACIGSSSPTSTIRTAKGYVYIPAGTYKLTTDWVIQSVLSLKVIGDGKAATTLVASGTGFTNAVVSVDGAQHCYFTGFSIKGDGTEGASGSTSNPIPWAVQVTKNTATFSPTTQNLLDQLWVQPFNWQGGLWIGAPATTANQVDGCTIRDSLIQGGGSSSFSFTTKWLYGIQTGNGTFGNQYNHVFHNTAPAQVQTGVWCNASGFEWYGGEPAVNAVDFLVNPGAQTSISGIQSQNSGRFISQTTGNSSSFPVSVRDCQFISSVTNADGKWVNVASQSRSWEFSTVRCISSNVNPIMSFNGAGNPETVTLVNVAQNNTLAAGVVVAANGGGTVSISNYQQLNSSGQLVASVPHQVTVSNKSATFSPVHYGAKGNGTTDDTAAVQACFAAAITAGGTVEFGTYTFKTTSPVTLNGAVKMRGTSGAVTGGMTNSASDLFTIVNGANIVTVESCSLVSGTGGGHIFNASGASVSAWRFTGAYLNQGNAAKAIWYQYQGGAIDFSINDNCLFYCNAAASLSPMSFLALAGACNSVKVSRSRFTGGSSMTVPFFNFAPDSGAHTDTNVGMTAGSPTVTNTSAVSSDLGLRVYSSNFAGGSALITAVTPGTGYTVNVNATANLSGQTCLIGLQGWYEELKFDHVVWEVLPAGAIWGNGIYTISIEDCAHWDVLATSDVYHFYKGNTGYPCQNILVKGGRGGAPTGGANNFYADSNCLNIKLDSFGAGWAQAPVISSPSGQTTIINGVNGTSTPTVQIPGLTVPSVTWITTSGTSTYNVPSGATTIEVYLQAGGGGGGSGALTASGQAGGGGGGNAGGYATKSFAASDLGSSVSVTVGSGGGGAAAVSSAGSGSAGTGGGASTFGSFLRTSGGGAGNGGTSAAGGTVSATVGVGTLWGSAGGAGSATTTGSAGAAPTVPAGASGGGGGAGTTGAAAANGGATQIPVIGSGSNTGSGGVAGGASPTAGTQPTVKGIPSCGGGGGASAFGAATTAQTGATAFYGGGGGGGGGCSAGTSSGGGGTGGPGFALIIAHFS